MKIFIAGASGFVGEPVVRDLCAVGHTVIAPHHSEADVTRAEDMLRAVEVGTDAIVYLPGLLREFPKQGLTFQNVHVEGVRNLLAAAKYAGVKRWIHMSALGAAPNAMTEYYRTKWEAEVLVRNSGLEWTILRPSLIFDDRPRKQHSFVSEVAKAIRMAPFVPILGNGNFLLQPVSVDDVSHTILQSLATSETIGQTYELGGPEKLSYREVVVRIARSIHSKKPAMPIPLGAILFAARLFDRFTWFPITREEILMLRDGNYLRDADEERKWRHTFELPLKRFAPVVS